MSYQNSSGVGSSPAVANGVVYVGFEDGYVYGLNARNGDLLWSYATDGSVSSSPAVANGVVYVGSDGGNMYAFSLEYFSSEAGPTKCPVMRTLHPDFNLKMFKPDAIPSDAEF